MSDRGSRDEVNSNYSGAESGPAIARLCYVDDSRTSAYVIRRLLQPYGYQVDYFQSAEPAFVALIQEDYDLLLTDLKVSSKGMDGDDLIRTLRNSGHPKISTLPVIVITGTTDPRILVDVYDAGANQVMNKPVDASELDGHIRRLLFERRPDLKVVDRQRGGRDNVVPLASAQRTAANPSQSGNDQTDQSISSKPTLLTEEVINESGIPLLEDSPNSIAMPDSSVGHSADGPQTGEQNEERPQKEKLSEDISSSEEEDKESLIERAVSKQDEIIQGQTENNPEDMIPEQDEDRLRVLSVDQDQHELESADTSIDDIEKSQAEVDQQDVADSINLGQEDNDRPEISSSEPEIDSDQEPYSKNAYITESENNILQEMDKHALVIRERNNIFGEAGLSSHFVSLFELIGTKGLLKRVLLAVIGLVAVLWLWNIYFDKGKPVEVVAVKSGEIYQSITVPGRVVSKQRTNVSSSYAGRIIKIFVKEGDRVKTGQTLAQLDDREMVSRLNRARANLVNARESVVQAERNLNRLNKAYKNGAVARQFVDDAEVDLRSARSKAGISESEVRSATLDVNKQKITAPFSGTITARYAELGQWVGPTETLFTLVDESQREIEVRVDASDSVAINVGQVVAVSSDAFPGLEWKESVTRLGTAADNKNHSNSVKVYVSLGGDAPSLRIGQQVDTDIRTAWNPNTLKVPFEALINRDGKTYVAVVNRNHVELTPVETGIEDFSMVEIKQGLNEGQKIILAKGQFLKNGEKVYPARRAK